MENGNPKTSQSTYFLMSRAKLLMIQTVKRLMRSTMDICRHQSIHMRNSKANSITSLLNVFLKDKRESPDFCLWHLHFLYLAKMIRIMIMTCLKETTKKNQSKRKISPCLLQSREWEVVQVQKWRQQSRKITPIECQESVQPIIKQLETTKMTL